MTPEPRSDADETPGREPQEPAPAHRHRRGDPEPCDEEWCRQHRAECEAMCLMNGWPEGHPVLLPGPDGLPCLCACPGPMSCPEYCAEVQPELDAYCHASGLPPGTPVAVVMPQGKVCYCECGAAARAAPAEPVELQPCSGEECARLRAQIDASCRELGYPPGTPVLVAKPGGGCCICTCRGA